MNTNIIKYIDKKFNFIEFFNRETGAYIRTGVIENGKDTGIDPFMRSFPQLIDVGIMGSCPNGRLGICAKAGIQCYQNGLTRNDPNMKLQDYESILKQCEGKTFQFALGGCGDPNLHENFKEILDLSAKYGIVPNYTTSGINLTDEQIDLTKKFCGAVAVSWYRNDITRTSIDRFIAAGIKTNIHYVLGNNTIDEAINRLKNNDFPKGINAIIFLLHKPIGQGTKENVLDVNDPRVKEFYQLIDPTKFDFKIGFDSCNVPGILTFNDRIANESMDTCEAARYSCYIDAQMNMIPCSFDNQALNWAVNLNEYTIQEAWDSDKFEHFRNKFRNSCPGCNKKELCLGGCPIARDIVLCNNELKLLK